MAHVSGGVLLPAGAVEHQHAAAAVGGDHGAVAVCAALVKQPLAGLVAGVAAGLGVAVRGALVGQRHRLQRVARLIQLQCGIGVGDGLLLGGGVLLVRGRHGVAVGIGGGVGGALEVQGLIAGHVEGGLVVVVVALQIGGGVAQLLGVLAGVVAGHIHQTDHVLERGHGHGLAEGQLQVLLQGVAVLLGIGGVLLDGGGYLLLGVVVGAVAVGLGFLGLLHDQRHLLDGVIVDELRPGDLALVLNAQEHLGGVVQDIALARLGLLLGLADLLGVGDALCRQILTGLLFS